LRRMWSASGGESRVALDFHADLLPAVLGCACTEATPTIWHAAHDKKRINFIAPSEFSRDVSFT
jgi:hypothetical protein